MRPILSVAIRAATPETDFSTESPQPSMGSVAIRLIRPEPSRPCAGRTCVTGLSWRRDRIQGALHAVGHVQGKVLSAPLGAELLGVQDYLVPHA